jgi:hypothetical protein
LAIGPNDDFAHRLAPDASLASPHVDDRAAAICSLSSLVMRRLRDPRSEIRVNLETLARILFFRKNKSTNFSTPFLIAPRNTRCLGRSDERDTGHVGFVRPGGTHSKNRRRRQPSTNTTACWPRWPSKIMRASGAAARM